MTPLTEREADAVASSHYYDGEEIEMTEPTYIHIEYRISTQNDGSWGTGATDEQAAIVAENCAALLREFARRTWPEAELTIHATREISTFALATDNEGGTFYADDRGTPCDTLKELLGRHWTEEALWSPEFDAVVYLDNEAGK